MVWLSYQWAPALLPRSARRFGALEGIFTGVKSLADSFGKAKPCECFLFLAWESRIGRGTTNHGYCHN